jgi:predicted anti-sigma-YlaC factor YlaD
MLLISHLAPNPLMKWVLLAVGIAVVAVAVLGTGIVGLGTTHYCTPPIGHITPMIISGQTSPFRVGVIPLCGS